MDSIVVGYASSICEAGKIEDPIYDKKGRESERNFLLERKSSNLTINFSFILHVMFSTYAL